MYLIAQSVETGSVIVAVSLIVFIGVLMVVAMLKYDVDGVLKIWGGLGTIVGLIVGTMGTYFFTRAEIEKAEAQVAATEQRAESQVAAAEKRAESATSMLASFTANNPWRNLIVAEHGNGKSDVEKVDDEVPMEEDELDKEPGTTANLPE